MYSIEFDYVLHKGYFAPMIPLKLKGKFNWFEAWAFVDSGATYSIFHPKELTGTGLVYPYGEMRMVVVGDGSFIPVYFIKLPMKIGEVEFIAEVGFSEKLGVGFNLLGRKDVFENFEVCFDDTKKRVVFHKER